ncbi:MAG: FKBP-type peptidyl-prolyl cis-trans isomerase [Ekhidna sp.]
MNYLKFLFISSITALLISCGGAEVEPRADPDVQRALDIALIEDYIIENNFTGVDTTESGVRYIILDDGGRSEDIECGENCIDESDEVRFRYTGMLLDGTIFDSSVQKVGDSLNQYYKENPALFESDTIPLFPDSKVYQASSITYTQSGWSVRGFITGFSDGVSATFNKMNVGGTARIIIPSDLAYGASTPSYLIPRNAVLVFDLFPERVEKQ